LLYALPAKRNSARVNLWRKLKKFGALQLKTSAYILPDDATQFERFQWLATEIRDAEGDATLIRAAEIEGVSNARLIQMFNEARATDYAELIEDCRETLGRHKKRKNFQLASSLEQHRRRFDEIKKVDYFNSPKGDAAQMTLQQVERLTSRKSEVAPQKLNPRDFRGKTWLTRPRPGIDRAGSAWLIRTFIDPRARFIFGTDPTKHPDALPFDMADAEFSHHGDDCTFETLVKRFGIADKAALKIAEMVHDADLEDGKFQRCECIGINTVLSGWAKSQMTDAELLSKGIECFEALYKQLRT
jgi:hypothetical protein